MRSSDTGSLLCQQQRRKWTRERLAQTVLGGTFSVWQRIFMWKMGFSRWRRQSAFSGRLTPWRIFWACGPTHQCVQYSDNFLPVMMCAWGVTLKRPTGSVLWGGYKPTGTSSTRDYAALIATRKWSQVNWPQTDRLSTGCPERSWSNPTPHPRKSPVPIVYLCQEQHSTSLDRWGDSQGGQRVAAYSGYTSCTDPCGTW